jgi:type I restriction enzyme R subunit
MLFNENTRVKIPALVHFTRLGYDFVPLKPHSEGIVYDGETNIFIEIFQKSISRINNIELSRDAALALINTLSNKLSDNSLGRPFYKILVDGVDGIRLIDFANPDNNSFNVVTELTYKNGEDEFRPDIVPLLNGIPLSFVEVKIPNNREGLIAERKRIETRFRNKKFLKFANITQMMVFSNNMEYDTESIVPVEGAFYAAPNYTRSKFSCFREERNLSSLVGPIDSEKEITILRDTNTPSVRGTSEYSFNLRPDSPTNRIITSLFSKERYLFILKYGFAYVEKTNKEGITEIEKHIMRYPQLFATFAIQQKLSEGVRKGIIWHTQGSGKTALAYFNVRCLKDYFQKQNAITKFYFIVDRLDLLTQATGEFHARGLHFVTVDSKEKFIKNIQTIGSSSGEDEINVVNIQKFSEESITRAADYNVNIQRIYFLDEAHRSYNPKGSFLSNLMNSDRNAIIIALTGTPLIGEGYNTKDVFGNYLHKYFYNLSIADGYTLKLMREGIETSYRAYLQSALDEIKTLKGSLSKREFYAHPKFVSRMVEYIVKDFKESHIRFGDDTFGGMLVCDSSNQARSIFAELKEYPELSKALILHDEDDKETRRDYEVRFKNGEIDLLVVYNMLLTGFDAHRLKKLYLCRVIKAHNLLQTLTRVNRPYKEFRYGYIVDFADIREEFDKTNRAYFAELQAELGDAFQNYSEIFKDQKEIEAEIAEIMRVLFDYETGNLELFDQQVSLIPTEKKEKLYGLYHALENYKALYNLIKLFGYEELQKKVDAEKINKLAAIVERRIGLINFKENLEKKENMSGLLNLAISNLDFQFRKISEKEMKVADSFRAEWEKVRREFTKNQDWKDPEYISLFEELKRILSQKNIEELTASEMEENTQELERLYQKIREKNRVDELLVNKYEGDAKFMRAHKRLLEKCPELTQDKVTLFHVLSDIKEQTDDLVLKREDILDNEAYFSAGLDPIAISACEHNNLEVTERKIDCLRICISREYFEERHMAAS